MKIEMHKCWKSGRALRIAFLKFHLFPLQCLNVSSFVDDLHGFWEGFLGGCCLSLARELQVVSYL